MSRLIKKSNRYFYESTLIKKENENLSTVKWKRCKYTFRSLYIIEIQNKTKNMKAIAPSW